MKVINKDITTIERGVLLNGVNCQRRMGSGVAKAYLTKWPIVKEQYLRTTPGIGKMDLVEIVPEELYVANCYTQRYYGYDGAKYADIAAIYQSVIGAANAAKERNLEVYTPLIGAGLGGLEAEAVKEALITVERITNVPFTLCLI